jgi:hypothetical protein
MIESRRHAHGSGILTEHLVEKGEPMPPRMEDRSPRYKASGLGWYRISWVYGRLTVVEDLGILAFGERGYRKRTVRCVCDCGKQIEVHLSSLRAGNSGSCGCLALQIRRQMHVTHGQSYTKLYRTWKDMRDRVRSPHNKCFKDYGGRGIKICGEWDDFAAFMEWATKSGCEDGLTIERNDVDGDYCPENCKWIPMSKQARNRQDTLWLTAFEETKPIVEWSEDDRCGVSYQTLAQRVAAQWDPEEAITSPLGTRVFSTRVRSNNRMLTAWGETWCLADWAEDPRCAVTWTLLGRLRCGWNPEDAISRPLPA